MITTRLWRRMMPRRTPTESVRYKERRKLESPESAASYDGIYVATAWQRPGGISEQAASFGVYEKDESKWYIPFELLAGLTPEPGDLVVDGKGTEYTVLSSNVVGGLTTWELSARNLILSLGLRDTITIERPLIAYDLAGVATKEWPPDGGQTVYAGIPARVQLQDQKLQDERGARALQGTYQVVVPRQVRVTNEDRIRLTDGTILDVVGYHAPYRIDELPVIDAIQKI